jgi:ATP-dependent Clp protease ATP-binding subunit ClpB
MALNPNRWTLKTQEAFQAAIDQARARNNPQVTPEHLLVALLGQEQGVVLPVLEKLGPQKLGGSPLALRNQLEEALSRLPKAYGAEAQVSRALREALEAADGVRADLGDEYLSTEHILLAMADRLGVDREDMLAALREVRGSQRVASQTPEETYQIGRAHV